MPKATRTNRVLWFSQAIAFTVCLATTALAQTSNRPLDDVNARVDRDDIVFVVERHAGETRGVFVSASSTSLVISVNGRTREIAASEIVYIEKRGDALWNGAIIGGAILGFGFMGGAGASCSPHCSSDVPAAAAFGAAVGAGIGATIDYLHAGRTLVYGKKRGAKVAPAATTLGSLWSSVTPGDPLTVRLRDGRTLDGEYSKATDRYLTIDVDGHSREIQAGDVRQVTLNRGGNHLKRGLLVGIPTGALFGTRPCYSVDATSSAVSCAGGVLIGMAAGGAIGALIGGRVWGRTVVYDAAQNGKQSMLHVDVWPLVTPQSAGVTVSLTF